MDEWEKQILFWRSHLDIFIEDYLGAKDSESIADSENTNRIDLYPFQHSVMRAYGNCRDIKDVESRSLGKTFKAALGLSALCILYPESPGMIISRTAEQAKEVIKYIQSLASTNNNLSREILHPITITKDIAIVRFKNGSTLTARAVNKDGSSIRGWHGKFVYIDEACFIKSDIMRNVIMPMLKYKRPIAYLKKDDGFVDFQSKLIETTSAYLKSTHFFTRYKECIVDIINGADDIYVCGIPCTAGVDYGIFSPEEIEDERRKTTDAEFEMEYMARFVGAVDGTYYPYDLTAPCRILENIELHQPKDSKSDYVLSLDVATSEKDGADNAALGVFKLIPKKDGSYLVHMVYMATYHGKKLEDLAREVRKMCLRFPNIMKVIVDANSLGEGVVEFLEMPYIDENNKEHMPFVVDTVLGGVGIPIVRAFIGNNDRNNAGAIALKRYFQNKALLLPVPYVDVMKDYDEKGYVPTEKGEKKDRDKVDRGMLLEEAAIYQNADALQFELGTIKPIPIASGIKYDTEKASDHKDRYSCVMMAIHYVDELEKANREELRNKSSESALAISYSWN